MVIMKIPRAFVSRLTPSPEMSWAMLRVIDLGAHCLGEEERGRKGEDEEGQFLFSDGGNRAGRT
jgi:hypothetical protein